MTVPPCRCKDLSCGPLQCRSLGTLCSSATSSGRRAPPPRPEARIVGPRVTGKALIIGYGNPLRGDDGIGPAAAALLAGDAADGAEVLACHQLLPELAEIGRSRVCHLHRRGDRPSCRPGRRQRAQPTPRPPRRWPTMSTRHPAGDVQRLYGSAPRAFLFRVEQRSFELGADLSAPCSLRCPPSSRRAPPARTAPPEPLIVARLRPRRGPGRASAGSADPRRRRSGNSDGQAV